MKLSDIPPLMRGIAPAIRELRDAHAKRIERLEALNHDAIARIDKCAQLISALSGRVAALERKLLAKD